MFLQKIGQNQMKYLDSDETALAMEICLEENVSTSSTVYTT